MANGTLKVSQVDVLTTSGTGTISIVPPATNTNRTLTLPDQTATIATLTTPSFATTIGVGAATASASGAGISFPATQSASTDANTLDDYEEGTFTPTLVGGFSSGPTGYTQQLGRYTKIGRLVHIQVDIDPDGATSNASRISIGNFPFTSAGSPNSGAVIAYQTGFNTNAGDLLVVQANNTKADFYTSAGTDRNGNAANVNINTNIRFSAVYMV